MTKILFLHGWHSVPGGVKPSYLREHGFEVLNPALDYDDFEAAIATAQSEFDRHHPTIVVGSSRGGAIAMNMNSGDAKLVLLCPAWKNWGEAKSVKQNTAILHSRNDEVIPFEDSEELVANSRHSNVSLTEVGNDHRLADESSLAVMLWVCNLLVAGEELPSSVVDGEIFRRSKKKTKGHVHEEASYICDACGEEIVIPLDLSEGSHQTYVEDCPVCCRANTIHVAIDELGNAQIYAEPEQDYD